MSDDAHYLDGYLSETLPALGLDADTYAPYITGYAEDNDDDDGGGGDALDDLIALLRASSETHGADDAAWDALKDEITNRRRAHVSGESVRKEMQALEIQAATATNLQGEIALARQNAAIIEARKQKALADGKLENMSEEKRALMSKFGYEEDAPPEPGQGAGNAAAPATNREHAAAVSCQEAKEKRASHSKTKAEARKETKQAKLDKLAKKEERRRKAGKRERQKM